MENAQGELEARAEENISRQDAATILSRVFEIKGDAVPAVDESSFTDVSEISDYASSYVKNLVSLGVITGYPDKTIKPRNNVTLAETLTMLDHISGTVLNKEESYTGSYNGNVVLNTAGTELHDVTISGNLYLTEGIGQGNVTLNHVNVHGTTYIKGGGDHSISIADSTFTGNVIVAKPDGKIRIRTGGQTKINYIEVRSGATLEQSEGSENSLVNVNIKPTDSSQGVTLIGNFSNVLISSQARLDLKQGTVESLEISNDAAPLKSKLILETGVTISSLVANAAVEITGEGSIREATINYNDVILVKWPEQVKVASGITTMIANNPVKEGIHSPLAVPVFGGGGGGGKKIDTTDADAESVALAKQLLTIGDTSGLIADKIDLPTQGANNTPITWKSDNDGAIQIHSSVTGAVYGKVLRPEVGQPDATVTLTAMISKGSSKDTKSFAVVVKARDKNLNFLTADGYKSEIIDNRNEVIVYVPSSTDMNHVKLNFEFTGELAKLGDNEIVSGESVALNYEQRFVIGTDHFDTRTYQLIVHKVETGLATVVINTYNQEPIQRDLKVDVTMKLIDGSRYSYNIGLYSGDIKIKGRGNSSWGMPKKSYAVSMDKSNSVLDMPADDDWVLIANYADKTLMRNYSAYEFARNLNMMYSPRMRYVELFINGEYLGNYLLGEKLKIAPDRLPINKMTSKDKTGDSITGGYLIEKDGLDRLDEGDVYFQTDRITGMNVFAIKDPKSSKLNKEQLTYITNYFHKAENALYSDQFTDPTTGYPSYFNVDSIIDWYMVNELYKNVDAAFGTSVYLYKDKNGKISMGPVWDFDIGAGNIDYNGNDDPTGFYIKNAMWISRFFEDPAFVQKVKDRWNEINQKQVPELLTLINQTGSQLQSSQEVNFTKWPILGTYVWPNASGWEQRTTYESEVRYMGDWLQQRIQWLDEAINDLE